jgi:hypothetical protein
LLFWCEPQNNIANPIKPETTKKGMKVKHLRFCYQLSVSGDFGAHDVLEEDE